MEHHVTKVIEPFIERGLFVTAEQAVLEMAQAYILHQIEQCHMVTNAMKNKYGMTYEHFDAYLKSRSATLASHPDPKLNQAVMDEEQDALDWKIAREMLQSWLGLQTEINTP